MSYDLLSFGDGTKKQIKAQKNADAQNMMLQLASRGGPLSGAGVPAELQGSQSAILPYYMAEIEKQLGLDAGSMYKALKSDPTLKIADYKNLLDTFANPIANNKALASDLASGKLAEQDIAEARPVFDARTGVADAKRSAGLEALRETLNEIDSIQSGKGYSGDSTGKRMLRFNARRSIGTSSAEDLANAKLANASDLRSIQSLGRDKRLAAINLPNEMAMNAVNMKRLPNKLATEDFNDSLKPFQMFNLGPHSFNGVDALPTTYNAGDEIAQIGSTIGGSLAKYYSNKANMPKTGGNYTGGSGGNYTDGNYGGGDFSGDFYDGGGGGGEDFSNYA